MPKRGRKFLIGGFAMMAVSLFGLEQASAVTLENQNLALTGSGWTLSGNPEGVEGNDCIGILPVLAQGATEIDCVSLAQAMMIVRGVEGVTINGQFDETMTNLVKSFQVAQGIAVEGEATGAIGFATWPKLICAPEKQQADGSCDGLVRVEVPEDSVAVDDGVNNDDVADVNANDDILGNILKDVNDQVANNQGNNNQADVNQVDNNQADNNQVNQRGNNQLNKQAANKQAANKQAANKQRNGNQNINGLANNVAADVEAQQADVIQQRLNANKNKNGNNGNDAQARTGLTGNDNNLVMGEQANKQAQQPARTGAQTNNATGKQKDAKGKTGNAANAQSKAEVEKKEREQAKKAEQAKLKKSKVERQTNNSAQERQATQAALAKKNKKAQAQQTASPAAKKRKAKGTIAKTTVDGQIKSQEQQAKKAAAEKAAIDDARAKARQALAADNVKATNKGPTFPLNICDAICQAAKKVGPPVPKVGPPVPKADSTNTTPTKSTASGTKTPAPGKVPPFSKAGKEKKAAEAKSK